MSIIAHAAATLAAQAAVDEAIEKYGEDNAAFLYCGFAWVTIRPARGKFVADLKKARIGSPGTYGGYTVSSNAMFKVPPRLGQSMELKEIGARAYADKLEEFGINATVGTRDD